MVMESILATTHAQKLTYLDEPSSGGTFWEHVCTSPWAVAPECPESPGDAAP